MQPALTKTPNGNICFLAFLSDFGLFEVHTSEVFPPALWVRLALFSLEGSWNYYFILVLWQWDSLSWIETLLGLVQQKQNKGMFPSPKISQYQSIT